MPIEIECPGCGQGYASPERHAGKEINCPACGAAIRVPALESESKPGEVSKPKPSETEDSTTIEIQCPSCEARYVSPARHAGKEINCPACGSLIRVPKLALQPETKSVSKSKPAGPSQRGYALTTSMPGLLEEELASDPTVLDPLADGKPSLSAGTTLPTLPSKRKKPAGGFLPGKIKLSPRAKKILAGVAVFIVGVFIVVWIPALFWLSVASMVFGGSMLLLVGGFWCLGIAFSEDALCGLLWLFVPFYNLYYVISRFDECRKPLSLVLLGTLLLFTPFLVLVGGVVVRDRADMAALELPTGSPDEPYPDKSTDSVRYERRLNATVDGVMKYKINVKDNGRFIGDMLLYLPKGEHPPKSLACVLVAPAGSNMVTGRYVGSGDKKEHLPYVRAGFAVLAYSLRGGVSTPSLCTDRQLAREMRRFWSGQAGVQDARNAIAFLETDVPEVDLDHLYTAGHSSAGTAALLVAMHEPRIKACAAYAPVSDVEAHLGPEAIAAAERLVTGAANQIKRSSPRTHEARLNCPVFLFHSRTDQVVPVQQTLEFGERLNSLGKPVTLEIVPSGDHYNPMISQGIPKAIGWLRSLGAPGIVVLHWQDPGSSSAGFAGSQPRRSHTRVAGGRVSLPTSDRTASRLDVPERAGTVPPQTVPPRTAVPRVSRPASPRSVPDKAPRYSSHPGASDRFTGTFEQRNRRYVRQTMADLIAGDDATVAHRVKWFPAAKRPTIGLRWGVGVTVTGVASPPRRLISVSDLAKVTGPAGPAVGNGLQERLSSGEFGKWPDAGDEKYRQVAILGSGSQSRLVDQARNAGLDMVAVFELIVKSLGVGTKTETIMRLRFVDVAIGEPLWVSGRLSDIKIRAAMHEGRDLAGDFVGKATAEIDQNFCLKPMPSLKPEHIQGRLATLAEEASDSPDSLPILVELRYYQAKQLLTPEQATPIYNKIVGDDKGSTLATGDGDQRRQVLNEWLGWK